MELLASLKDGSMKALANKLKSPQVTEKASYLSKINKNIIEAKNFSQQNVKAVEGQIKNFVANFV